MIPLVYADPDASLDPVRFGLAPSRDAFDSRFPESSAAEATLALEQESMRAGAIARRKGDVPRAMVSSSRSHAAIYRAPYQDRPWYLGRVSACLDPAGMPTAWRHRVACVADLSHASPDDAFNAEVSAVEGAVEIPYAIPNVLIEHVAKELPGLDIRPWDGAGLAHNAFTVESFVDELARLADAGPASYRRKLLADSPRALDVLDLAVSRSGWNAALKNGAGRGLALLAARGSFLAVVAEVETVYSEVRVRRVSCALDCGRTSDRSSAARDVEAGIALALGTTLHGEIPAIEFHLVDSAEPPGAIEACAAAAIVPAIANAIFDASGKRIRNLPLVATSQECP